MARKADGFLTVDGRFYDDEAEADLYNSTRILEGAWHDEHYGEITFEDLLKFIKDNTDTIHDYLHNVEVLTPKETKETTTGDVENE